MHFLENVWIFIEISLRFVPKGPINNIPALVQIMAWHRSGDKPSSEPMMVSLLMHICVTRPQWVNSMAFGNEYQNLSDVIFKLIIKTHQITPQKTVIELDDILLKSLWPRNGSGVADLDILLLVLHQAIIWTNDILLTGSFGTTEWKFEKKKYQHVIKKMFWKCCWQNVDHLFWP